VFFFNYTLHFPEVLILKVHLSPRPSETAGEVLFSVYMLLCMRKWSNYRYEKFRQWFWYHATQFSAKSRSLGQKAAMDWWRCLANVDKVRVRFIVPCTICFILFCHNCITNIYIVLYVPKTKCLFLFNFFVNCTMCTAFMYKLKLYTKFGVCSFNGCINK